MQALVYDSASLPLASWTALCDRDPQATVFHRAVWSQVWERVRADARAEWRVLADGSGRWIGGIPLVRFSRFGITRYFSGPLGAYGGWVGERTGEYSGALAEWMRTLTRPWVAQLVVTPFHPAERGVYPGRTVERERLVLDLCDAHAGGLWPDTMRPDTLRNLHMARRYNWRIDCVTDPDGVERTRSLWEQTAARHGRRFDRERWRFYRALFDLLGPTATLFWWIAQDDRGPAATIICLHSRARMWYHDGAMDLARSEGRPMYALFDRAINTAMELGCRAFDFGSGPANAPGLARFKDGWGAAAETYCEYHYRKIWWPRR